VSLSDNISVESLVNNLQNILHNQVKIPQVPFISNFHLFKQAAEIGILPRADHQVTLGELFDAFTEPAVFGLKVLYNLGSHKLKVDYTLTLSCFNFQLKQEIEGSGEHQDAEP
jgi:hypothetical protein